MRDRRRTQWASGGLDPFYQEVLAYGTSQGYQLPTIQQRKWENKKLIGLKACGAMDECVAIWNAATNGDINFSGINWKAPGTFQLIPSALVPYYIRKQGWQGDGAAAMYFRTQFIPNTHGGTKYTQNNAGVACGVLTHVSDSGDVEFGASDASNSDRVLLLGASAGSATYCMNAATGRAVANASSIGRYIVKRIDASTIGLFKNGSSIDSGAVASTGLPNVEMYILAENGNGTARNFSGRRVSHVYFGSNFAGIEAAMDAVEATYMVDIATRDPEERIITFIGNSLTNGTGTTKGLSYPVQTLVKLNRPLDYRNLSTPGYTTQQMIDNFIPVLGNYLDPDAVVVLFPGTNDIRTGISAATAWTNTQTLVSAIQSYGVTRIVLGTLMADTARTAGQEIEAQALITSVRNGATGIGCVVADFAANANLSTWSATYFADAVHTNNLGAGEMATITNTSVDALI